MASSALFGLALSGEQSATLRLGSWQSPVLVMFLARSGKGKKPFLIKKKNVQEPDWPVIAHLQPRVWLECG